MEFLYKYFNDFGTRVTRHIMDNCLIFFLVYKKDVSDVFDTYAWNNATLKLAVTQEISCHFPDKSSNMKEWYLVDVKGLR
jgi:hypothetical protein